MASMTFSLRRLAVLATSAALAVAAPVSNSSKVPSYVLDYAPVAWLSADETYFPSAWSYQLEYTHPEMNFKNISGAPSPLTLDNLDQLNKFMNGSGNDQQVYLSANDDFTTKPAWLVGSQPDAQGKTAGEPSCAIIVADKGNGTTDAFYMYFYPFNLGGKVFGHEVDNHVGDVEHTMVRFVNGQPTAMWFSQHNDGEAFEYAALEKYQGGKRPVAYVARGTHANYAQGGKHDHTIPGHNLPVHLFITDYTDQGHLWDPAANAYVYSYDVASQKFAAYDGQAPTGYLNFKGKWGDAELTDDRQHKILGIDLTATWSGGPSGPVDKELDRKGVCTDKDGNCDVKDKIGA